MVHLQCHLGTETQAFARRGARTVGLDLSGAAIAEARRIAATAGREIEYVLDEGLRRRRGPGRAAVRRGLHRQGRLCYLPDLDRWADVVARLLRPGGRAYVVEFHPVLYALGLVPRSPDERDLLLRNDYCRPGTAGNRRDAQ